MVHRGWMFLCNRNFSSIRQDVLACARLEENKKLTERDGLYHTTLRDFIVYGEIMFLALRWYYGGRRKCVRENRYEKYKWPQT